MNESYHKLFFSEKLHKKYKPDLEELFFFNTNQKKYFSQIEKNVEIYGIITIQEKDDHISLLFNSALTFNTIYILDSDNIDAGLIGVVVYLIKEDCGNIIHIAVDPICTKHGDLSKEMVTLRIIEKVRTIMSGKFILKMKLPYKNIEINTDKRLIRIIE